MLPSSSLVQMELTSSLTMSVFTCAKKIPLRNNIDNELSCQIPSNVFAASNCLATMQYRIVHVEHSIPNVLSGWRGILSCGNI